MADNTTATHEAGSKDGHRRGPGRLILVLTACLLAVLLTANCWMLSAQFRDVADSRRERAFWAVCHTGTTAEQRAEYFLKLVTDGNKEWRSAYLSKMTLDGVNLSKTNLVQIELASGSFVDASFSSADLTGAALDLSDFSQSDFSKALLRNATFFKSRLVEADFRNADLLSTSFEQCVAHQAKFVAAKMGDAFCPMADFTDADLTGADMSGANLEAAILKGANLALTNFHTATLTDTDFTDTNWWRCRGLTSVQMDDLTLMFPPTPDASESRQRDFEMWLGKRIDERARPESE